jgi:hypothetical protein
VYQKIGLTVEDFEGVRYKRIAHIRALLAEGALDEKLRWRQPAAAASAVRETVAAC